MKYVWGNKIRSSLVTLNMKDNGVKLVKYEIFRKYADKILWNDIRISQNGLKSDKTVGNYIKLCCRYELKM